MTKKQKAAKEFFSKPRTLKECQEIIIRFNGILPDKPITLTNVEEAVCDVFLNEMIELDLHFKRA